MSEQEIISRAKNQLLSMQIDSNLDFIQVAVPDPTPLPVIVEDKYPVITAELKRPYWLVQFNRNSNYPNRWDFDHII